MFRWACSGSDGLPEWIDRGERKRMKKPPVFIRECLSCIERKEGLQIQVGDVCVSLGRGHEVVWQSGEEELSFTLSPLQPTNLPPISVP